MNTKIKKSIFALIVACIMALPAFAADTPEDVTGVTASPIDTTSIGVSWNPAKDASGGLVDHYRIYYGTVSAIEAGEYANDIDTPNNSTYHVITELAENTTYYFSVTAIDSKDVESESYSLETNTTTANSENQEEDTVPPIVTEVNVVNKNQINIKFSEAVKLPDLIPEAAFTITEQISPSNILEVQSAVIDAEESTIVNLETAEQAKNVNYIVTAGVAMTDLAGNPIISGNTDSGVFLGSDLEPEVVEEEVVVEEVVVEEVVVEEVEEPTIEEILEETIVDTTPPEDITDLVITFKEQLEKFIIVMDWTASINSAKDMVDQMLYQSMDRGKTYDSGKSLGTETAHHEIADMEGGQEYTFKITTKDSAGNESVGVVKSIRLPQTGVGIGLLIMGSLAIAGRMLKRKK